MRITTVPISLKILLKGQLKYMSQFYNILAVANDEEELKEVRQNEEVVTCGIAMTRQITPFADLIALVKLIRLCRKERPDIVHTHTPKAGTLGVLAAKIAGVKTRIHTVAGLPLMEATGFKYKVLSAVERFTYACATHVWPNSHGLESYISQNIYTSPKVRVLGKGSSNGINTTYFSLDSVDKPVLETLKMQHGINDGDFVFISIGRITAAKGINELVEAFSALGSKYSHAKLLLLGDYESDLDPLKDKTVNEINTNKQIIGCGYQKDIRPLLALSHCLVHPSYREGFPNVVLQALSMNIPALVSDINGCNEIVEHQFNGLIYPPKRVDALFDSLKVVLDDHVLLERLKSNARESVVARYEQKVVWELIKAEYDKILGA